MNNIGDHGFILDYYQLDGISTISPFMVGYHLYYMVFLYDFNYIIIENLYQI